MTWHMKGQSNYNNPTGFHMGFYMDINGFVSGLYDTRRMPYHIEAQDPYMAFGIKSQPWLLGQKQVEFGLWEDYRVRIDSSGVWGYHTVSGLWFSLFGGGDDSTPDHNSLNGLNDGDDYEHITQTQVNALHDIYTLEVHDNTEHDPDYEEANANIQSHVGSPPVDSHHAKYTDGEVQALSINNLSEDASPQLGGDLDLNDKTFTHEFTAAVSLVAGNLCYMNGSGKMDKAQGDAEATCDTLLAMCLDTISADADGTFLIFGKWTTTGLTAGVEYWVSDITAGAITNTKPSSTGDIIRHIGTSLSTTVLFFNPDKTYVEYTT